jgi:hypothetical protein
MDPYAEPPPPRPRSGCLWGCLGLLAAVVLVVSGVFFFGAWHFYKGFDNDVRVQQVMETLRRDPRAEAVLGRNIKLLEMQTHTYAFETGRGGTAGYVLHVTGSQNEADVEATLDIKDNNSKIIKLVLTPKDGRPLYLIGAPPGNPMMDDSI